MPDEDSKRLAHSALVKRVLGPGGQAAAEERTQAFDNDGLTAPLDSLIAKVAASPARVSDDELAAAKAAGYSEDQIFELVVCAAVGQATRLYDAGLAALDEAVERRDHAS